MDAILWFLLGCCLILVILSLLTAGHAFNKATALEKRLDNMTAFRSGGGGGGAPAHPSNSKPSSSSIDALSKDRSSLN